MPEARGTSWTLGVDDAPAIARLLTQLGYETAPDQARQRIERLDPARSTIVGHRVEGHVVGFGAARVEWTLQRDEPVARIIALAVDPDHQRTGAGTYLVRRLEGWARDVGARSITVNSGGARRGAHRFYRARGYEETGRRFGRSL